MSIEAVSCFREKRAALTELAKFLVPIDCVVNWNFMPNVDGSNETIARNRWKRDITAQLRYLQGVVSVWWEADSVRSFCSRVRRRCRGNARCRPVARGVSMSRHSWRTRDPLSKSKTSLLTFFFHSNHFKVQPNLEQQVLAFGSFQLLNILPLNVFKNFARMKYFGLQKERFLFFWVFEIRRAVIWSIKDLPSVKKGQSKYRDSETLVSRVLNRNPRAVACSIIDHIH